MGLGLLFLEMLQEVLVETSPINITDLLQMSFHPLVSHDIVLFKPLLYGIISGPQCCDGSLAFGHQVRESTFVNNMLE